MNNDHPTGWLAGSRQLVGVTSGSIRSQFNRRGTEQNKVFSVNYKSWNSPSYTADHRWFYAPMNDSNHEGKSHETWTQNHLRSTSRLYSAWYPSLDTHNCWNRQVRSDPTRSSLVLYSRRTLNIHRKLSAISVNLVLWNHSHKLMTTKEETTRLACGWLIYLISKCFTLFFNSVWFALCLDK